jgi:hypothetical protein
VHQIAQATHEARKTITHATALSYCLHRRTDAIGKDLFCADHDGDDVP